MEMHHVASRNNVKSIILTGATQFTSTERVLNIVQTPDQDEGAQGWMRGLAGEERRWRL